MSNSRITYGPVTGRYIPTPIDFARCGTEAQYAAHYRRGEKPCRACRQAASRARAERLEKQRNRKNTP